MSTNLWNKVCKTDPKHTKKAKLGAMQITAIDPQYQRKNATQIFGAFGIGWGLSNVGYTTHEIGDTVLLQFDADMWYIWEGEKGVFPVTSQVKMAYMTSGGSGYLKVDDDAAKKAQTDALTKGLSMLGFNSDVFEGLFDDNKYVQQVKKEFAEKTPQAQEAKQKHDAVLKAKKEEVTALIDMLGDNSPGAKAVWDTFDREEKKALWLPEDAGGCLSTEYKNRLTAISKQS